MGNCFGCCGSERDINLNGRKLRIKRLLGEGGFSYVYLVEDQLQGDKRHYALKKITCQENEDLQVAVREAQMYRQFNHVNLIKLIDVMNQKKHGSEATDVLLLFPCYRSGNLQKLIENMAVRGSEFTETEALALFISICAGAKELHHHEPPHAHRDIKAANVLLTDNNTPILMDFGSLVPARVHISTRQQAVALQDEAAERSTAPYRAPELFDVPSEGLIDERTDIWSLGCLLYAIAFLQSPFEWSTNATGGSIALAVNNGRVEFPKPCSYSKEFCDLILFMLNTDRTARPYIDDVIDRSREILRQQLNH